MVTEGDTQKSTGVSGFSSESNEVRLLTDKGPGTRDSIFNDKTEDATHI